MDPPNYCVVVTPSVLCFNQNTKPYHEHHVYVLLHMVNGKLNFIALILKLSSNLLLDQILSNTAQFIIVILMQLQLLLFFSSLISHTRTRHSQAREARFSIFFGETQCFLLCRVKQVKLVAHDRPTATSHMLRINLTHKLGSLSTPFAHCSVALRMLCREWEPECLYVVPV